MICILENFRIKEIDEVNENNVFYYYYKGIIITNNQELIQSEFGNEIANKLFGVSLMSLAKTFPFAYFIQEETKDVSTKEEVIAQLNIIPRYVYFNLRSLILTLWFVKDNSSNLRFELSHEESFGLGRLQIDEMKFSNCKGSFESVTYTLEEIGLAIQFLQNINSISERKPSETFDAHDYNSNNKIDRAIIFLSYARNTTFLPAKISFYMSIYECLFTNDQEQISHKMAERAANYLGNDRADRISIYNDLKAAYGVRSNYFHGQSLKSKYNNIKNLIDLSVKIDDLTRRIMTKIFNEDVERFTSKGSSTIDEWYISLLFR